MKTLASLALLLVPALASADTTFTTLDRADEVNRVGASSSLQFFPEGSLDAFGIREEVFGSYYQNGIGAYAQIPFSHVFSNGLDNPTAFGNLELGAFHVMHLGPGLSLSLHAGVALPTATNGYFFTSQAERITDMVDALGGATWLRLGASLRGNNQKLFYQADLGLDLALTTDEGVTTVPGLRLNAAVGAHAGPVDLTAEAAYVQALGNGNQHMQSVAASIRVPLGRFTPSLSYVMPFDSDQVIGHIVSIGLTAAY